MGINWNKFDRMETVEEKRAYVKRQSAKEKAKRQSAGKFDRLQESILEAERVRFTDSESWKWYGFILPSEIVYDFDPEATPTEWDAYLDLTDEEINEWIGENMFVRIFSDYDCTGRPFTTGITWHRNPCGLISYVHRMALDV